LKFRLIAGERMTEDRKEHWSEFARRIALLLICLEVGAFVASLLSSDGPFWLWRAAGFATVGCAAVSAVIGVALVQAGVIGGIPVVRTWGGVVLLVNVAPLAGLLILGELAGLP
jgi:hypothetical protein